MRLCIFNLISLRISIACLLFLQVKTYVHLLDQCSQNWFAVASLYENTLNEIKKSKPEIVEVFTRSDNAGCYHCAFLLLSIPGISQRTGIKTKRYDFSESNSGKDICDRHISPMKSHIRQYVNEGNDVENAGDMKKTLDSHHGVKGCHISVVNWRPTDRVYINTFGKESKQCRISNFVRKVSECAKVTRAW